MILFLSRKAKVYNGRKKKKKRNKKIYRRKVKRR
jgi:hypothetical protein